MSKRTHRTRIGCVITFKPEVSKAEAAMGLNQIRHLLDLPDTVPEPLGTVQAALDRGETVRFRPSEWGERSFQMTDKLVEYDEYWGGPVWYIP